MPMKTLGKILIGIGGFVVLSAIVVLMVPSEPAQPKAAPEVLVAAPVAAEKEIVEEVEEGGGVETRAVLEDRVLPETSPAPAQSPLYAVTKVVDGDTITISMNGVSETLRLIGIDTPETVDPRKDVQCFGKEASDKTKELLTGKKVRIGKDASQGERDKYQRLLAYVYREDGLFINEYLVEEGYAHEYTYNTPYTYQVDFKAAEMSAKEKQKGLWKPGACEKANGETGAGATPAPAPEPTYTPSPKSGGYVCGTNTYNCTDFKTHDEAQSVYVMCGGASNDIHKLDSDKDGEACESLP